MRALCLLFCVWAVDSHGHEGRPVYVEVTEEATGEYGVKWKIPPVMSSGQEPRIRLNGSRCQPVRPLSRTSVALTGYERYRCRDDLADLRVEIDYPSSNPALGSLVIFERLESPAKQFFSSPEQTSVALLTQTDGWEVFSQYTQAGIAHILKGYDHLAFVLCLMMMAGTGRRLVWTVTGFTLAHSVTLSAATLDLVRLPTLLVESLIALSILLLAVELQRHFKNERARSLESVPLSLTWRYPFLCAALFGLLHGFGFASVLQDLGLPDDLKLPALLFFNVGVELGQLLFIGAALAVIGIALNASSWVRRHFKAAQRWLTFGLGCTSAFWLVERLMSW